MDSKIIELHDAYLHGDMNRRVFMQRLGILAGGSVMAASLLPLLEYDYAQAAIVAPDDSRLQTGRISYAGASGDMKGYQAKPKGDQKLPAVLVVHENRGLNPHIEDVTRRIALAGFVAMAPDALSASGGTPPVEKDAIEMIRKLDGEETLKNFVAAAAYLNTNPPGHRQGGGGRLLLGRSHGQPASGALAGCGCGGALLWTPAQGGRRAQDQSFLAAALWRRG